MSSETIVTALFLISAVIAAGVLINAIFPTITRTADTFGSASSEADTRIRTDFKIVNTYADASTAKIWCKNIGSARLHANEVDMADIYIGSPSNFDRFSLAGKYADLTNSYWDPGETLSITLTGISSLLPDNAGEDVYVAIVLPNGVRRDLEFTRS
ncbi:MAG: Archaebacterial flagellin [Methanoregulaceae archaeon PtaU1.Bin222]|nr:MAG: Archaebacterial flagellin [Methanoregulaceae archaeon PtaU1.Bin222]